MTGYLTCDANTARLDDLHRRAGRRVAARNAVTLTPARDAQPIVLGATTGAEHATASPRRMRRRPRWACRAA